MILCVNANAAIDKTVVVRDFRLGEIHRPESVLPVPGGKGANCAKGLKRLGESPVVCGWVGGFNGQFIEAGLRQQGIDAAFVQVEAESRTCLSIVDPEAGAITELYENGDPIPADKIEELKGVFGSLVGKCRAVTMSGSLPPGVPLDFYAQLAEIASAAGVPVYLDSSGEPLRQGVEAGRAFLVKPNAREFDGLVGREPEGPDDLAAMAVQVSVQHGMIVVVSLGAEGALVAGRGDAESEVFRVRPPRVQVRSAVGSGDCMLAGLVYGLTHGFTLRDAARYGVAAGTANALSLGPGIFDMADFESALAQTEVLEL
jgi:tagatose 6-phosphate kinase